MSAVSNVYISFSDFCGDPCGTFGASSYDVNKLSDNVIFIEITPALQRVLIAKANYLKKTG